MRLWKLFCSSFVLSFLVGVASIAEEHLRPCPSCRCLEQVGSVVFAPAEVDMSLEGLTDRLPDCRWTEDSHVFGNTQPLIVGARDRYSNVRADAELRRICETTWVRMVDLIETEVTGSCAASLPSDAPPVLQELAARCDVDDFVTTRTIVNQDAFLARISREDTEEACPTAKDMHILLWVLVRRDNESFVNNSRLFERLERDLQNYPSALFPLALILQHADQNRPLQRKGLERFTELYGKGLIPGARVAWLTDEILVHENEAQRYGSFFTCKDGKAVLSPPLEDPARVDEFRKEVGLSTIEEQIAEYGDRCTR